MKALQRILHNPTVLFCALAIVAVLSIAIPLAWTVWNIITTHHR